MDKINDKINKWDRKGKSISTIMCKITKSKKLDDTEKFQTLLNTLGAYYYTEKHYNVVNMDVFELYYEKFMGPNGKNEEEYKRLFRLANNNLNFVNTVVLTRCTKKLKNINFAKINAQQRKIYENIIKYSQKYLNKNFDCSLFYLSKEVQKELEQDNKKILDAVIDEFKNKHNVSQDLFSINSVNDFSMSY